MPHSKFYAFDALAGVLKRDVGQAALTSDGYVGTQWDQGAAVLTDGICVINIESIDIAGNDEIYAFRIIGSNVADRSDGEILAMTQIGDAGTIPIETRDTLVGDRVELRFRTEKNETKFRYIDLHLDVTGATASIGFSAYVSKEL